MDRQTFLAWELASQDSLDVKMSYIDLAGDLVAGILLSQIIYWHLPSKNTAGSRMRVKHDGHEWIAKQRADWHDEIRITAKQFDRAAAILEERGLIKTRVYRFAGEPTKHVRLVWEVFLPKLDSLVQESLRHSDADARNKPQSGKTEYPRGIKRNTPEAQNGIPQRDIPLTDSTSDSTSENTNNLSAAPEGASGMGGQRVHFDNEPKEASNGIISHLE